MKGSLFPLGQPLRELEDQPRAGFVPGLQPACCPWWLECPGMWASYPGQAPSQGSLSAGRCTPTVEALLLPRALQSASQYCRA